MPIVYNPQTRRYEQDGVAIDPANITALVLKLRDKMKGFALSMTKRLQNGEIALNQWRRDMTELLNNGHITAASIGRGGVIRMTPKDWDKVEKKVQWQGQYLKRFGWLVVNGVISASALKQRAESYADPIYTSYTTAFRDAQTEGKDEKEMMCRLVQSSKEGCDECNSDAADGWMPVSEMKEIGSRECGQWCLCEIEFADDEINADIRANVDSQF